MPLLLAALTALAGFVIGAAIMLADHVFIGMIIGLASLPVALAVWVMPGHSAPAGVAAVVSAVAFGYALAAVAGAGADTVYYGFLMLLAGLPLLVWVRRGRSVAALGEPI